MSWCFSLRNRRRLKLHASQDLFQLAEHRPAINRGDAFEIAVPFGSNTQGKFVACPIIEGVIIARVGLLRRSDSGILDFAEFRRADSYLRGPVCDFVRRLFPR